MFICSNCKGIIVQYNDKCTKCGKDIIDSNGIYIFTNKGNIDINNNDKYYGFDTIASHYDSSRNRLEDSKDGVLIGEYLGKGKTILEVGAGTGYHSIPIAKTGCKVIAADISMNMLKILKFKVDQDNIKNLIPCRMNAYELNIADHSVDAVLINQVFQHVENPYKIINEIKRVLKPDGKFFNIYYKGEIISNEQEKKEFQELNLKISKMYELEAKKSGQVLLKRFGWLSQKEQQLNIFKHFKLSDTITSDLLENKITLTIKIVLDQYKNRVSTSQAIINENINETIVTNIEQKLIQEYGERVLNIKLDTIEKTSIQVFEKMN